MINGSAERESKSLHARIEKLDLELAIGDRPGLSDQLIQPLFGHGAVALARRRRLRAPRLAAAHRSAHGIARTCPGRSGP